MTNREAQILQWIKDNPMISQEELAAKAGIKRSSVAVHISNLMKKGYIQGKGYITSNPDYCTIVGGVNIDIGGKPDEPLIEKDSNPGRVSMSLGGVGRNIAHNMTLLGIPTKLVTALGSDVNAQKITESCMELGIDVSSSYHSTTEPTSTYLFISSDDGDMALAISDMNIYRHMTPEFMASRMELLNHSRIIMVDTNIPEETIAYICRNSKVPVYSDPVSCKKAQKLLPVLDRLHTIAPNTLEAEILSGVTIRTEADLQKASDALLRKGVKRVFITMGGDGIYAADETGHLKLPNLKTHLVNATGGGDAFMAGLVLAAQHNLPLRETALCGLAAGSIAVESRKTINDNLSASEVFQRAGIHNISLTGGLLS